MIDDYWTFRLYGYHSSDLGEKSHKPIVAVCDECGEYRFVNKGSAGDLCSTCAKSTTGKANKGRLCGDKNPQYGKFGADHPAFGNIVSDDVKQKMSEDKMGDKNPNFGISPSDETRELLRKASTGKHHTMDSRRKQRESKIGERNPNWKGGVTPVITAIRKTPAYKNWRKAVFERDHFTCQLCGDSNGGNLQAHHIQHVRDHKNDLMVIDIDNGTTLCEECHRETHRRNDL